MKSIRWMDYKSLERTDRDNFGMFNFAFYGSRWVEKRAWWGIIPGLNLLIIISILTAWISAPFRIGAHNSMMSKLRKNAYDIENSHNTFRLIRNRQGRMGLCKWGLSYDCARMVILESKYAHIERTSKGLFIVTDTKRKMGLYNAKKNKWILPCEYDLIIEDSYHNDYTVKDGNRTLRYNQHGERVMR